MFNGFHAMGTAGWVVMMLLWVAAFAAIVWFIARVAPTAAGRESRRGENPGEILDRRLAAGEIDVPTYDQLKTRLDPQPPAGTR